LDVFYMTLDAAPGGFLDKFDTRTKEEVELAKANQKLAFELLGDKGLWSKPFAEYIQKIEHGIVKQGGFDEHCYIRKQGPHMDPEAGPFAFSRENPTCYIPSTATNYMYPSFDSDTYKVVFNGSSNAGQLDPEVGGDIMMKFERFVFFNREADVTRRAYMQVSKFHLALPLKGFTHAYRQRGEQDRLIRKWLYTTYRPYVEAKSYDYENAFKIYWDGPGVQMSLILDIIIERDGMLVFLSVFMVFALMWIHTRSFFIACVSLSEIVLSFLAWIFIYRVVLGLQVLSILHVLSVFLLLAIGTDDVFVFWDTWKHSALLQVVELPPHLTNAEATHLLRKMAAKKNQEDLADLEHLKDEAGEEGVAMPADKPGEDVFTPPWFPKNATRTTNVFSTDPESRLALRLAWTLRKSGSAMLVTTATTVVAFFAIGVSRITPVRNFGIFMGGIVTVNYILVLACFPATVVIYHKQVPAQVLPLRAGCGACAGPVGPAG
jgi:hypothetical protein